MIVFGTDFDDTLYFHAVQGAREEDIAAIEKFQKAGNVFGLVTGRSLVMRDQVEDMLHHRVNFDFFIYSNGALLCDKEDHVLKEHFLPEEFVREVFNDMEDVGFFFHTRNELLGTPGAEGQREFDFRIVHSLDEFDPSKVYSVSFVHLNEKGKRILEENRNRTDVVTVPNSRFADFNPLDANKGLALLEMAKEVYGKKTENGTVIPKSASIGDSFNDLAMLKEADCSFTFPTSPKEVQDGADHLVSGIAEAVVLLLKQDEE